MIPCAKNEKVCKLWTQSVLNISTSINGKWGLGSHSNYPNSNLDELSLFIILVPSGNPLPSCVGKTGILTSL